MSRAYGSQREDAGPWGLWKPEGGCCSMEPMEARGRVLVLGAYKPEGGCWSLKLVFDNQEEVCL